MLNFDFLDKGLGIISPAHFVYDFSTKMFLMLYSINWPNFIAWLPLLLEILGNMCIAIVCYPGCDVMDFEINLIFLIELFFLHDQKVMTKALISWEQKEILRWNKSIFHHFQRASSYQKLSQTLECAFKSYLTPIPSYLDMKIKLGADIAVDEQHQFDLVYYKLVHQRSVALLTTAKNYSGKIIKVSNINQFM